MTQPAMLVDDQRLLAVLSDQEASQVHGQRGRPGASANAKNRDNAAGALWRRQLAADQTYVQAIECLSELADAHRPHQILDATGTHGLDNQVRVRFVGYGNHRVPTMRLLLDRLASLNCGVGIAIESDHPYREFGSMQPLEQQQIAVVASIVVETAGEAAALLDHRLAQRVHGLPSTHRLAAHRPTASY